jgi:glycine/D-amino acid oxidase-like deaminating enzyme
MVELARDGIHAYRDWSSFTGLTRPRAKFHQDGILWINSEGRAWAKAERDRMRSLDIGAEVLSYKEVADRFPAVSTCLSAPDLEYATEHHCMPDGDFLFETDGGYFEPVDALTDLAEALEGAGVQIRRDTKVSAVNCSDSRATGVTLKKGEVISAGTVINTTGPWCNDILEPLGLASPWPLKPTRIQVMHVDRPASIPGKIPVCCDLIGGIYFREQNRGQQIVIGSTLEEDEREVVDPDDHPDWIEDDFMAAKLHALKHRIPSLPGTTRATGYVGLYTVNQDDVHPVVGSTPIENFLIANGFSGHGFKIGPAIGSLLAQAVTGDRIEHDTNVSADFLGFGRESLKVDTKSVLA